MDELLRFIPKVKTLVHVGANEGQEVPIYLAAGIAHIHLVGVDGDRHLIGLGAELGQHVARVVGEPLGCGAIGLGGKRNRTTDLDDHLRPGQERRYLCLKCLGTREMSGASTAWRPPPRQRCWVWIAWSIWAKRTPSDKR